MGTRLMTYTIGANQPIIRRNLDAYAKAIDKLDARHEEAIKQKTALDVAFSQLDMNEAEDEWKNQLRNQMQAEIDNAAMFGNYASAYDQAVMSAGKLLSNPAVIGRIRANAQYKEAKKLVDSRNDIGQTTKDRWTEQNPYYYEDKYDDNGNVVGGSKWTPNWTPVTTVDLTDIYAKVKQFVAAEAGGGNKVVMLDENGNPTEDMTKGFYGMAYSIGAKYERVPEEKLRAAFEAVFRQTPGAMESVMQDRDDRIWEYMKSDDKGKQAFIGSDILNDSGAIKSPQDYLADRVNPVLKTMAYNHVYTEMSVGDAYAKRLQFIKAKQESNAEAQAAYMLQGTQPTAYGANITYNTQEVGEQYATTYQSTLGELAKLFPR